MEENAVGVVAPLAEQAPDHGTGGTHANTVEVCLDGRFEIGGLREQVSISLIEQGIAHQVDDAQSEPKAGRTQLGDGVDGLLDGHLFQQAH